MKLMDRTKGITGIGFDAELGMFQASDEWWDRMELINKSCAKFRTKTLEHRELMEIVFTGAAATGKHYWTRGERTIEDNGGSSNSVQSLGMRPFADLIPSVGIDVDAKSSMEGVEPAVDPSAKRKRNTPASSGKSRKPTSGASALADSVNNLSNVVCTKSQEVTVRHLTGNESLYTISECMDRLKSIPALVSTPLFHFASSLMDNADYRDQVMMCQPDDDHIIGWLTQKQLQSSTAAPFANLFSARRALSKWWPCLTAKVAATLTSSSKLTKWLFRYKNKITGRTCKHVVRAFGLCVNQRTHGLAVEESVAMFIHVLRGFKNRAIQEGFQHSGETVSRHVHNVLEAMKKFTVVHCRPTTNQNVRHPHLRSKMKYLSFKDCIGAIDGTHVVAKVTGPKAVTYFGCKYCHTQNIMAVVDFDMCFTFVSLGWEGNMHDSRVFAEIINNENVPFPHPEEDNVELSFQNSLCTNMHSMFK